MTLSNIVNQITTAPSNVFFKEDVIHPESGAVVYEMGDPVDAEAQNYLRTWGILYSEAVVFHGPEAEIDKDKDAYFSEQRDDDDYFDFDDEDEEVFDDFGEGDDMPSWIQESERDQIKLFMQCLESELWETSICFPGYTITLDRCEFHGPFIVFESWTSLVDGEKMTHRFFYETDFQKHPVPREEPVDTKRITEWLTCQILTYFTMTGKVNLVP